MIKNSDAGFYYWIEAIIIGLNEGKIEEGIEKLKEALEYNTDSELHIRILNNLAAFYSEIEEYDKALHYSEQATKLAKRKSLNAHLKQQIFFQQARLQSNLRKYNEAIFESKLAIQYTVEVGNLFLLDDLYLLLANSYKELKEYESAKENVEIAYTIAKVKSHSQLIPYIDRTQKQIEALNE